MSEPLARRYPCSGFWGAGHNTHLQAPALNMFDLVNQSITGRREEVYDVVLREPMAEMFLPPPGVTVTPLTIKRGIVLEPTPSNQQHLKGS
jgi:hypothetical protein